MAIAGNTAWVPSRSVRLNYRGRAELGNQTTNKPKKLVIDDPAEAVLLLLYGDEDVYEVDARWPVAATVVKVIDLIQNAREQHAANLERERRRAEKGGGSSDDHGSGIKRDVTAQSRPGDRGTVAPL